MNTHTFNRAPKYTKVKELRGKTNSPPKTVGDFNTPFSITDRTMEEDQEGNRELELHYKLIALTNIYREHSSQQQNTHSSQVHKEYLDHVWPQKRFKRLTKF